MNDLPDYSKLYRLPFSKNDNFNGWIEITTACNIKYPGCYRGCDSTDHKGIHKTLGEIKNELLELKRIRNCSMISVSGGKPLLHPDIAEIISFIKNIKMNPVLFTNGKVLTDKVLLKLKKAGLTGVVIRVDSLQKKSSALTEKESNKERSLFAELCNWYDIFLIFTACINNNNLSQIRDIITFAEKNSRKVGQLILILKRQLVFDKKDILTDSEFVFREDFISQLRNDVPDLQFAAYLGSQSENQKAKWLQGFRYILNNKVLGYADAKFVELLQMLYHFKTGKYLGIPDKKKNFLSMPVLMFLSLINRSMRKIFYSFLLSSVLNPLNFFRKAAVQGITAVIPPHFINGRRDLCDACPDAILYKGELVPSCSL